MIEVVITRTDKACVWLDENDVRRLKTACSKTAGVYYAAGFPQEAYQYDSLRDDLHELCLIFDSEIS